MLQAPFPGDGEGMTPLVPAAARPAARDGERTSTEIRRFAIFWSAASVAVLAFVAIASLLASGFRDDAGRRAAATTAAQLAAVRLQADIQRQAGDALAYQVTGDARYRAQFLAAGRDTRAHVADLRTAVSAAARPADRATLNAVLTEVTSWEHSAGIALVRRRGAQGGLAPSADPAPTGRVAD